MSCISCFFLSFGNSESAMIALLCLFGGVSIASWNALDVLTVELYPSDKRCACPPRAPRAPARSAGSLCLQGRAGGPLAAGSGGRLLPPPRASAVTCPLLPARPLGRPCWAGGGGLCGAWNEASCKAEPVLPVSQPRWLLQGPWHRGRGAGGGRAGKRLTPLRLSLPHRTTAFGFLNALCKLAAVLGISIFTSFVGITKAVPILLASAALALGSSLALRLPETRGQVLQ